MKDIPEGQMLIASSQNWKTGSASLSSVRHRVPRLIHASWCQRVPVAERRKQHRHSVYHVCLVKQGRASMILNGLNVSMFTGSLVLVSPNEPHCFLVAPGEQSIYSEATFEVLDERDLPISLPLDQLLGMWAGRLLTGWSAGSVAPPAFQKLLEEDLKRLVASCLENGDQRRSFAINRALQTLLESVVKILENARSLPADPLCEAQNFMERNVHHQLSVGELARHAGWSTNHFIRVFADRFGKTPLAYHQDLRINAAKKLLRQTRHPIKQIADWTGFSDVYYFTRFFSSKVGSPPAAYRRHLQAAEGFK